MMKFGRESSPPENSEPDTPIEKPPHIDYFDAAEADPRRHRVRWRFGNPGPGADHPGDGTQIARDIQLLKDLL